MKIFILIYLLSSKLMASENSIVDEVKLYFAPTIQYISPELPPEVRINESIISFTGLNRFAHLRLNTNSQFTKIEGVSLLAFGNVDFLKSFFQYFCLTDNACRVFYKDRLEISTEGIDLQDFTERHHIEFNASYSRDLATEINTFFLDK